MTEHLYHVTFYNRLGSIAEDGLQPGRGRGIGGGIYDTHRQGAIFLTEEGGVYFWGSRAEEWAQYNSENVYDDGLAPVLLRVPEEYVEDCDEDEHGTQDARYDAFKCRIEIPPDDIEIWIGTTEQGRWANIEEWGDIPYDDAFEEECEDEYDEETDEQICWMSLKDSYYSPSPLMPDLSKFSDVKTKKLKTRLLR